MCRSGRCILLSGVIAIVFAEGVRRFETSNLYKGFYDWGLRGRLGLMPNCLEPQSQRPSRSGFEERDQGLAGAAKRISDFRRRGEHCGSADDAVFFQFAELRGENFFADASQKIAEFGEAQRAKRKAPDRLDFPLAAQDVDGGLNGTAMVRFHVGTPGLQICAYFAAAQCRYTMSRASQPECGRPSRAAERKQEQE